MQDAGYADISRLSQGISAAMFLLSASEIKIQLSGLVHQTEVEK